MAERCDVNPTVALVAGPDGVLDDLRTAGDGDYLESGLGVAAEE